MKKSFSSVFATFVAVSFEIIESRGPTTKKKKNGVTTKNSKHFSTFVFGRSFEVHRGDKLALRQSVGPYLAKFHHFGKTLQIFGKFF